MHAHAPPSETARALVENNRRFYDTLWSDCRLVHPDRFNTWPLVQSLVASSTQRLEVAPGLRPRLPIAGTYFVDISTPALAKLHAAGGSVALGQVTALPFGDGAFDLVCALDIVEHVENDDQALWELSRVVRPGGTLLISIPLHPARWTPFDEFVGHKRRYEPDVILTKLTARRFGVQKSGVFGMQPRSSFLLDAAIWWMTHQRERAMRWYNRVFPWSLRLQKPLQLAPGLIPMDAVDEILLVCRREA